jgi:hypothetical protein
LFLIKTFYQSIDLNRKNFIDQSIDLDADEIL